jgi:hypothetical protein
MSAGFGVCFQCGKTADRFSGEYSVPGSDHMSGSAGSSIAGTFRRLMGQMDFFGEQENDRS